MKPEFPAAFLRCPECRSPGTLRLAADVSDEREVRTGTLSCDHCQARFPVERGVGLLMRDAPEHITREAAGLERFADYMRRAGWTADTIRSLPDVEDGYWYVQARSMLQLEELITMRPGESLLDVGSNTCWASNRFAVAGLEVIALDIATTEMQGLFTSDYFIAGGETYFERVLGSMYDMPVAGASLDYVYCCEVLHHNDPESLKRTFREAFRVLKPGGRMLVINETLKTWRNRAGVDASAVEQYDGYEHAFWAPEYQWAARRAGFRTKVLETPYHWFFTSPVLPGTPPLREPGRRLRHELQRHPIGRWLALGYVNLIRGGVQLNMIATKPGSESRVRGFPPRTARRG